MPIASTPILQADGRLRTVWPILQKLKKKYGGSIEAVLATQDRVRQELERIQNSDAELKRHDDLIHRHQRTMSRLAQQLTRKRQEAAGRMTKAVRQELNALKMNQTQFLITVTSDDGEDAWGSTELIELSFCFLQMSESRFNRSPGSHLEVNCRASCWP